MTEEQPPPQDWFISNSPLADEMEFGDRRLPRSFWAKALEEVGELGCWAWMGGTRAGYGCFGLGSILPRSKKPRVKGARTPAAKTESTHIIAWTMAKGPVPEGKVLDHIVCSNKWCFRPSHLKAVTQSQNMLRYHEAKADICPRGHRTVRVQHGKQRLHKICRTCAYEANQRWRHGKGKEKYRVWEAQYREKRKTEAVA